MHYYARKVTLFSGNQGFYVNTILPESFKKVLSLSLQDQVILEMSLFWMFIWTPTLILFFTSIKPFPHAILEYPFPPLF